MLLYPVYNKSTKTWQNSDVCLASNDVVEILNMTPINK